MWSFGALCDDFFVSTRLRFKLDLTPTRETILHFFEQIGRKHPSVSRFRRRDDGGLVLDEDAQEDGGRRFVRLEPDMLKFGTCHAPPRDQLSDFCNTVLKLAPAYLSLSELDYDNMEVVFGFDLEYCGNHDELVAEALFGGHPLLAGLVQPDSRVIDFQPIVGFALNDECDLQAQVEIKSRTSCYEVRCNEYESTALSVFLTVRKFWSFDAPQELSELHGAMLATAEQIANERVVPHVVRPLAAAIASRR